MSAYQNLLQKLANADRLGVFLCRFSIFIVFAWIGWLKFIPYEADSIVPFVANSPFMSWLYNDPANYVQYMNAEGVLNEAHRAWHVANNTYGYSNGLGAVELLFAFLNYGALLVAKSGLGGRDTLFLNAFCNLHLFDFHA